MSDWYRVQRRELERRGGASLFVKHGLPEVLARAYPEYPWDPATFSEEGTAKRGYWSNKDNLMNFLSRAEKKLGIEEVFPVTFSLSLSETHLFV